MVLDTVTPLQTPSAKARTRGTIRPMTRLQAIERARLMASEVGKSIRYSMEAGHNGGADPDAFDPATHWRTKVLKLQRVTCDCVGFQCWNLGVDRLQRGFAAGWDWINTDSMIVDARTHAEWFEVISWPESGCLVVYPSIDFDHDGKRDRIGHVGMVVGMVDAHGKPLVEFEWSEKAKAYERLRVIQCSAGNDKRSGRAIVETDGRAWAGRDWYRGQHQSHWASVFLRFKRFAA